MKRILLKPLQQHMREYVGDEALKNKYNGYNDNENEIDKFIAELRLLKGLPFSYLVPDEKLLPPESIRFFILDESWLNALTDGALSIGRNTKNEALADAMLIRNIVENAAGKMGVLRFEIMHPNHRRTPSAPEVSGNIRSGFIMRSELVKKWNGLEAFGYDGDKNLKILRMESLSKEILICIFDGSLTKLVVSEPKTNLRFGCPDNSGIITLRSLDESTFGEPVKDKTLNLNNYTENNGKIKVAALAGAIKNELGTEIKSSELAFELIAVAKRAEFMKGSE